jgi:O-acetyl-ADP-ribose deacetylase
MSERRFLTTLPSGQRLSLWQIDITTVATDAIVNAANAGLSHGGGVAGAIVRKGGSIIQEESDRIGRVRTGEAAMTTAGTLPAKAVIHAVGPMWEEREPTKGDLQLESAVKAALEIAHRQNFESIAFPAISSGIFRFPKIRCAQVMTDAIVTWAEANSESSLQDLRFAINDDGTVGVFESYLVSRFGESNTAAS